MKYFSMFTGIGGFELGIQRATLSVRNGKTEDTESSTPEQGMESTTKGVQPNRDRSDHISSGESGQVSCVGYSEIDKYAIQTYEHNFGKEVKNYGDATKINTTELPDFDLLVGGFPCQAFSVAGKRAGFDDTRGTLIFDVVRVLRDKRPRHFILENVKGLLSHDSGKTFSHILEILTDSGYDVSWSIHNSKNYGVPQNRERIYLVGNLRGEPRPQVFPHEAHPRQDIVYDVKGSQRDRVYNRGGLAPTVPTMQGGNTHPKVVSVSRKDGVGKELDNAHTLSASDYRGLNRNQAQTGVIENQSIRRLTPIECERLQGFPDNWTIGSDTQRYKQCGNAVTVNVVEHVVRSIYV